MRMTILAAAIIGIAGGAAAQEMLTDPAAIQSCLCAEQTATALGTTLAQERRLYDERRTALAALDAKIAAQRQQNPVMDADQADALRALLTEREQAAADFAGPVTQRYAAAVARYNQAVAAYAGTCAKKSFDAAALAQARASLSCPKP
jgi:hypothetical protein